MKGFIVFVGSALATIAVGNQIFKLGERSDALREKCKQASEEVTAAALAAADRAAQ